MMQRYLEIWGIYRERGIEAAVEHFAPDVVVEEYDGAPGAQTWHGRAGLLEMWRRWQEGFDDFEFEPQGAPVQLRADAFAVPVRVRGTGRGSGVTVDWNLIMVSVMRDGLVAHQALVDTMEQARARVC